MSDTLKNAAEAVQTAETTALQALHDAIETFATAIDGAIAGLDYPEGFASNAKRIANMLKSGLWARNEVNALLNPTTIADPTVTPIAPVA